MSLTKSTLEGDFNLSSIVIRDVNGAENVWRLFPRSPLSKLFPVPDPRYGGIFVPIPTVSTEIHGYQILAKKIILFDINNDNNMVLFFPFLLKKTNILHLYFF